MNVMTRTRFDVVPLTKHIGAEIRGIDLREKPDDETIKRDLPGLARPPRHHLPGPEAVAGGFHPRHRLFRRARRIAPAGEILSEGLFQPPARHHADLQHPRERRADRRAARRRDDVPSRHDPRRGARARARCSTRSKFRRPAATRCSPAATPPMTRSIRPSAAGSKAGRPCTTTITASMQKGDGRALRPSANARIRCSAPTRTPARRRSTSTG